MSYKNKVIALSSALVALLLIYAAGLVFSPERFAARSESARLLAGSAADAASVSLGGAAGEAELVFRKDSGTWSLADQGQALPVQGARVEAFLGAVAGITRLSLRSDGSGGAAALAAYGLDEGKGHRVIIRGADGKLLADFMAGGYGPTGDEVYVKRGSAAAIYATDAGFASYLGQTRSSWLDLRVFPSPIKPDDVQGLSMNARLPLDGPGKPLTVAEWQATRKDGGWTGPGPALQTVAVESVLRSVLNLEGEDIASLPPPDAFASISGSITLDLSSGAKRVVEIGKAAGNNRFYVRAQGSAWVYEVESYTLKNIARPASALAGK
jgi:hypothetical protein